MPALPPQTPPSTRTAPGTSTPGSDSATITTWDTAYFLRTVAPECYAISRYVGALALHIG